LVCLPPESRVGNGVVSLAVECVITVGAFYLVVSGAKFPAIAEAVAAVRAGDTRLVVGVAVKLGDTFVDSLFLATVTKQAFGVEAEIFFAAAVIAAIVLITAKQVFGWLVTELAFKERHPQPP
jgi:hypothetical protein